MANAGAQFGESTGWLYPLWFRSPGRQTSRPEAHKREHETTRKRVGVFDLSLLAKFSVEGPDAYALVNWLSTNEIDVPVGRIVYTPWCSDDGTMIADVTITRVSEQRFLIIGTDTVQQSLYEALAQTLQSRRLAATIGDTTSGFAIIAVTGPCSRDLLSRLSPVDFSNQSFAYMTAQEIVVAGVSALALRVSYTGELGWELHVPCEYAVSVYDALMAEGERHGAAICGIDAIYQLGAEKGFLDFDYSIDSTMSPLEAMLEPFIKWNKPGGFRGRAALELLRTLPVKTRIVLFKTQTWPPESDTASGPTAGLAVKRNGEIVGSIVAVEYGYSVEAFVGYAQVTCTNGATDAWLMSGQWTIEGSAHATTHDTVQPITVGTTPWFDAERQRLR